MAAPPLATHKSETRGGTRTKRDQALEFEVGLCGEGWGCRPPGSRKRCSRRARSWSCFCLCTAPSDSGRRRTSPSWPASAPRTCGRGMRHVGMRQKVRLYPGCCLSSCVLGSAPLRAQPPSGLLYLPPVFLKMRSSNLTLQDLLEMGPVSKPVWEILRHSAILFASSFTVYSDESRKRNSAPSWILRVSSQTIFSSSFLFTMWPWLACNSLCRPG